MTELQKDQKDQNLENEALATQTKAAPQNSQQKVASILMLEAGIEFAFLIAGPLIAGIFLGNWLDYKYHKNFFVIVGILLGLLITCVAIYNRIIDYKKILEKKTKQ